MTQPDASSLDVVLRLAASAYLGRYTGVSRVHSESDLRLFFTWCAERDLPPLTAQRAQIELYVRWMQEVRRFKPCACRKLRPCSSRHMAILVDDSVEKIMSVHDAAFDLSGFARLRRAPQGCRVGERSAGSVLAVPLVLTQRLAQMGLIPDKRAGEEVAAKVFAPVDTDRPKKID